MIANFGTKNPLPECKALLWSRVMQWSFGVNQIAIALKHLKPAKYNVANVGLALEQEK